MTEKEVVAVCMALGSDVRHALWIMLLPHGSVGITAGVLAQKLSMAPARLTFHLRALVDAKLLFRRRVHRNLVYAVNEAMVAQISDHWAAFLPSLTSCVSAAEDIVSASERSLVEVG